MEEVRRCVRCGLDRHAVLGLLRALCPPHTGWEQQEAFVRSVLEDEVQCRFPGLAQYRARLLKMYLDDVTAEGGEVHEELLSAYLQVAHLRMALAADVLRPEGAPDARQAHRVFELPDGRLLPVRARVEFGDVGEALWPASIVLAEYFLASPKLLRGKRALELGAGVGFTGMVVASMGCERLTLTDISPVGMELLRTNLENANLEAKVERLDWAECSDSELTGYDIVFASDCWYDYEMVEHFSALIARICRLNPGCAFYNATALRNERTFALYKDAMAERDLQSVSLELPPDEFRFPVDPTLKYPIILERYELKE